MTLPAETQAALDKALAALRSGLGENLRACILYGSAVRGNFVPGVSDLNLLILLEESTPEAHAAMAEAMQGPVPIDPFVLGRAGLERSFEAFAIKFFSIRRHYRVLHGEDPLKDLKIDEDRLRFLTEQALRNLRLRVVHAFILFGRDVGRYGRWLAEMVAAIFTDLAEPLRRVGADVPDDFAERIPVLERGYETEAGVLREILKLKAQPRRLTSEEISQIHANLFRLLNHAVHWMEARWSPQEPPKQS